MATKAADIKKALVAEYLELSASKLGLVYNEADTDDKEYIKIINKKSLLVLGSDVSSMRKMADYTTFSAPVAAQPVEITPDTTVTRPGTGMSTRTVHQEGITKAQFPLYITLTREKLGIDLLAEGKEEMLAYVKAMSKAQATKEISNMIKLPRIATAPVAKAATPAAPVQDIPEGIYGIQHDGEVKCYLVDYGKAGGQWDGFLFLSRISSDDKYAIRNRDEKARILDMIRVDVEAAGRLAGHTLRQCRRCRRTLSDTKNPYFEIGMGPECGGKM